MNVLLVSPTFHPHHGGAESLADDLARLMVQRGHAVTVLTATGAAPNTPPWRQGARVLRLRDPRPGLPWLIHPGLLARHVRAACQHRALLRNGEFDAVSLIRIDESARHVLRERRRLGFRLSAYLHGGELRSLQHRSQRFRRILHWVLREADAIVAVSADLRREAIRFAPKAAEKIVLLPNGIDVEAVRRAVPPSTTERPYALFAGRLERVKNPLFLIEAFARIAASAPELDLVIVGTGSQHGLIAGRVSGLGLGGRVRILGDQPRNAVFSLMKGARCLVVPSLAEAHPLVVLEAWAAGLLVLASAVKGLRDLVTEERGVQFSLDSTEGLATLLQRMASDASFLADRRRRLADLELELENLDIGALAGRHEELLLGSPQ
jgi:glycosyltransferase involved in cell wall biosynthesis